MCLRTLGITFEMLPRPLGGIPCQHEIDQKGVTIPDGFHLFPKVEIGHAQPHGCSTILFARCFLVPPEALHTI